MRIALLSEGLSGGIGRSFVNLSTQFVASGHEVDLLVHNGQHADSMLSQMPSRAKIIPLSTSHPVWGIWPFARYLRQRAPDVVMPDRDRMVIVALRARLLARQRVPVIARIPTNFANSLDWYAPRVRRRKLKRLAQYRQCDGIIAISTGVAEGFVKVTGLPARRVETIPNPAVTERLYRLSTEDCHDVVKYKVGRTPQFIAVGRLVADKDFPTLLRAFKHAVRRRDATLLILGEGDERSILEAMVDELGLRDRVFLPGYKANPYPYMAQADALVLSSIREGFGNVIAESLALGVPVVATDCPSGPGEILQGGKLGSLVEPGDDRAMAAAMLSVLRSSPAREALRSGVQAYRDTEIAGRYVDYFRRSGAGERRR